MTPVLQGVLITDCNGFALFDPAVIGEVLGRDPTLGENLYARFFDSELGDDILRRGAVAPAFPMTDGDYDVRVIEAEPGSAFEGAEPYVTSGGFPLRVAGQLYAADLCVLRECHPPEAWLPLPVRSGFYEVTVAMYDLNSAIGVEMALSSRPSLPALSADLSINLDPEWMNPPT